MESNRAPNNQMALKGVVLVLALIAAGAFVLARGLDDEDDSEPAAAQPTPTATVEAEEIPDPVETPSEDGEAAPTPAPAPEETEEATAPPADEPRETAPALEEEELECRDPSTIGVLVANGTDVGGAAGRLSGELNTANYVTLRPVNATPQVNSAFYYRAGYEVDALCVARLLGESEKPLFPMPDPPPGGITIDTLGNAYVLVLIGPDSLAQRPG